MHGLAQAVLALSGAAKPQPGTPEALAALPEFAAPGGALAALSGFAADWPFDGPRAFYLDRCVFDSWLFQ